MNRLSYIIIMLCVIGLSGCAQKHPRYGEVNARRSSYVYNRIGTLMSVQRKSAIATTAGVKPGAVHQFDFISPDSILESVFHAFSNSRLKKLAAERITLRMFINNSGRIAAIDFLVNVNSKVTTVELEKLENALTKSLSVKLAKEDIPPADGLVTVILIIPFGKVLDGSFARN